MSDCECKRECEGKRTFLQGMYPRPQLLSLGIGLQVTLVGCLVQHRPVGSCVCVWVGAHVRVGVVGVMCAYVCVFVLRCAGLSVCK